MGAGNFLEMGDEGREDGKLVGLTYPLAQAMIRAESGDAKAADEVECLSSLVDHQSEVEVARELAEYLKSSKIILVEATRQVAIANEAAAAGHTAIDGAIQAS